MIVYTAPNHALHAPALELLDGRTQPYLESPRRVEIILEALEGHALRTPDVDAMPFISRLHDADYLHWLETAHERWQAVGKGDVIAPNYPVRGYASSFNPNRSTHPYALAGYYSTDTSAVVTAGTHRAALESASAAASAARFTLETRTSSYALCRPPGHHAGRGFMGGYCFLNNAAVAATVVTSSGGRAAILDVDYHHGNGTQDIFYTSSEVFTVSIHADPSVEYPHFAGYADETGALRGEGFNLNLPLSFGTDWAAWHAALEVALERIRGFQPDVLVVSAGFDTFGGDPLGRFALRTPDYLEMARCIAAIEVPTIIVQEGGYAVDDLGRNVAAFLEGFEN